MKKYPERVATKQDYLNLLAMPEYRARAIRDLKAIRDTKDDTATIAEEGIQQPAFTIYKPEITASDAKLAIAEYTKQSLDHSFTQSDGTSEFSPCSCTQKFRFVSDGKITKAYAVGEADNYTITEIPNPLPLWKQKRFVSRKEVSVLIQSMEEPTPIESPNRRAIK